MHMGEAHTLSMVTRHAEFEFFLRYAWIRRMRGRNRILLVLPMIINWHSVRWISGALNEHYLKF